MDIRHVKSFHARWFEIHYAVSLTSYKFKGSAFRVSNFKLLGATKTRNGVYHTRMFLGALASVMNIRDTCPALADVGSVHGMYQPRNVCHPKMLQHRPVVLRA